MIDDEILDIAHELAGAGGRALVIGGYVRDHLLGIGSKDVDIEVHDLPLDELEKVLARTGDVITVGRAFGVLRVKGLDVDFSLPRRDSKIAKGHRGFEVQCDPGLGIEEAMRRRDLTINSIALDPLTGEIIDPFDGRIDLKNRVLRATDRAHFSEDPLRGLRVAQLGARFRMRPDEELVKLCSELDLSELPGERIGAEFDKLLGKGQQPSIGLEILRETRLLRFFPEVAALVDVPQDPLWHPEGDVWVHTNMVIDRAAELRDGGGDDLALMYGALCHDLGKPATTFEEEGRIRSPCHSEAGVEPTQRLLERLRAPNDRVVRTCALVLHHLKPTLFVKDGAGARAYRRLARELDAADVSIELLVRVARSDHLGRTTAEALAETYDAGDAFLEKARSLDVHAEAPPDVVLGRHLIARGLAPGPDFGPILRQCRDVQDETGWDDPERILDRVLTDESGGGSS